jgi:hypothetical protein
MGKIDTSPEAVELKAAAAKTLAQAIRETRPGEVRVSPDWLDDIDATLRALAAERDDLRHMNVLAIHQRIAAEAERDALRRDVDECNNVNLGLVAERDAALAEASRHRHEANVRVDELRKMLREVGHDARGESTRMREALVKIAKQKRTDELVTAYDVEVADFEGAYDECIDTARAALEHKEEGLPVVLSPGVPAGEVHFVDPASGQVVGRIVGMKEEGR